MPVPGFVYVLTNTELPQFVKVGMTNELTRRLIEINTGAGVVGRWSAYGAVLTGDMRTLEAKAHLALTAFRVIGSAGTEIFKCTPKDAALAIVRQAITSGLKLYENTFPSEQTLAEEAACLAEQARINALIEKVCQRFPEAVALWAKALELESTGDIFPPGCPNFDTLNAASRRLSSISRSWGLGGHEDKLLQHVAAMYERKASLSPKSIFAQAGHASFVVRQSTR